MVSNISAGNIYDRNADTHSTMEGFQVWLYEELQLDVDLKHIGTRPSSNVNKLELCIKAEQDKSPVHLIVSIDTEIINPNYQSLTRYSIQMKAEEYWRDQKNYFDFLLHSTVSCAERNLVYFRYLADREQDRRTGKSDYADIMTLRISPE